MSGQDLLSPEIRRLRKKLRQIAGLEILQRELTGEEREKVSRKAELCARLAQLLARLPQEAQGIVGSDAEERGQETMKRRVQSRDAQESKAPVSGLPEEVPVKQSKLEDTKSTARPAETEGSTADTGFLAARESWEKVKFRLRSLEGHSDIITCVAVVDNHVVSGSRDTTVKVWHVPTATEQRHLGGHTGGVTCLSLPPPEHCNILARSLGLGSSERFILSGSVDSCVRVWALNSGSCIRSIYTFNSVMSLSFIPEGEGYIVTGSDGGKVEVWSWLSGECCHSVTAHEDSVTALKTHGPHLFSGSADGGVSVWEVTAGSRGDGAPLRRLTHWSPVHTGLAGVCCLSPRGERVYVADGRASLGVLDWRNGSVSRLANHGSVSGVSDCVTQTEGILIGSGFDLETGESSLNLRSLPDNRYLASLSWPESPRILCLATWLTPSGGHRWVTGGRSLTVWEQLPANTKKSDVQTRRLSPLDGPPLESGSDGEMTEEEESEEEYSSRDAAGKDTGPGTSWAHCVLL
ncbi:uncharacterized protein [Lepisosteus oculatus]|uniref:uncharacterized protein n=1 Tax=Lepisosteus oculatus TaxID=7918 RepID=UPI003713F25A